MTTSRQDAAIAAGMAAAVIAVPFCTQNDFLLNLTILIMVWSIFAVGFDLVFGLLGMVSFGHAAFLGAGGYALALATQRYGLPFEAGLALAIVAGAACAWIFSVFALRVSGIFFALVTLALSQLMYILADSKLREWTGGADGLPGIGRPELAGIDFFDTVNFYWYVAAVFALVMALMAMLRASPFGRAVAGVRQNEIRAAQLGYNVQRLKQITFLVSGAVGGLAGGLLAAVLMYMNPQMLHWTTSGDVIIMTLLGGAGTLWGPVAGVLLFEALKEWLSGWTPYWYGILGLVFILATLYFPQGVLGALQARWSRKRPPASAPASPSAPAVPLAPREGSPS
ncbi:branched-chain amino acid ABC transporter permease [Achromobacter xylosoxidans]|uniref:Branched-chain amino acid ABC transporter permease n=1 Tax=Alcaligenes xylosoxydans xylosoxydans TaxID=85698 RepID=A0A424WBN9_ALCXX|nr:branched-chain amino acid ABC transporter permease [Achromobacter xylosoxidans]MBC9906711.1 branched-chain amino acid ABC transporter permease [Achromobacter xylosoxidans]MBD0870265.1 branched-chain amino acid ABC transporter permease [Achromobacter xylosoxidans]QNP83667.1 branched-chain amino acid ABC transporter permease [Achromobacter xylosoxidans]RPJ90702.1 branched-chain amino acid ABC transporter permease [Achromobacter xylosoxidans]